ncbi:ATP-binding cassette sub-family A member 3-like isoform X2 [Stegodyphus dumicola]|uniref:ATP-binding cassette sub-family A member 3-like isoform X2 n=1 Tax=Stegodyphus dumicola TaxID=202533 RepID=UPI0015B266AA|nr:ATP-binding cassette sub-family A member 3-like isoform X2 [Stegodyphus dumicola]
MKTAAPSSIGLGMGTILWIFIANTVFYFALMWYFEGIFPEKHEVPQPWYFPFSVNYWVGNKPKDALYSVELPSEIETNREFFQSNRRQPFPGILIKNLTKVYDERQVINQINLKAYRGHITVLLGHNGAGKTRLISLLLGKYPPTSGTALIKRFDINIASEARRIPRFLGFCPDYDVLIEELTVEENLHFFCKVVIIDEPTKHMDFFSRRIVWDALQAEKVKRTILITSSHMKEAEALGDRIALMDKGHLQCYGTPKFFKKIYGAGYHLVIQKEPFCNVSNLSELVFAQIPDAKLCSDEDEITYLLPPASSHMFYFLFYDLEDQKEQLNIGTFKITEITLEELFDSASLNLSPGTYVKNSLMKKFVNPIEEAFSNSDSDEGAKNLLCNKKGNEGCILFTQQMWAHFKKRYIFSSRHILFSVSQILILPFMFMIGNALTYERSENLDFKELNTSLFHGTKIVCALDPDSNVSKDVADLYASLFSAPDETNLIHPIEENILHYLLRLAQEDIEVFNTKYAIAADFVDDSNKTYITAFYNAKIQHSAPIALINIHNAVFKYLTSGSSEYLFALHNHPLPVKNEYEQMVTSRYQLISVMLSSQDLMFGMSILMSSFIIVTVLENSSKSKHLQVNGILNLITYWFSSFIYDFSTYMLSCIFVLFIFITMEKDGFFTVEQIGRLLLLFVCHGLCGLSFVYCSTFFCQSVSAAVTQVFLKYIGGESKLIIII